MFIQKNYKHSKKSPNRNPYAWRKIILWTPNWKSQILRLSLTCARPKHKTNQCNVSEDVRGVFSWKSIAIYVTNPVNQTRRKQQNPKQSTKPRTFAIPTSQWKPKSCPKLHTKYLQSSNYNEPLQLQLKMCNIGNGRPIWVQILGGKTQVRYLMRYVGNNYPSYKWKDINIRRQP